MNGAVLLAFTVKFHNYAYLQEWCAQLWVGKVDIQKNLHYVELLSSMLDKCALEHWITSL